MTFLIPSKINRDIFSELESLFNPEQPLLKQFDTDEKYNPPITIESDNNTLFITAATPGYKKEDIKIEYENEFLKISGETKTDAETNTNQDGQRVHHREIKLGDFARTIKIGNGIDVDNAKADYTNGILKISIPKVEEAQPKRLLIG